MAIQIVSPANLRRAVAKLRSVATQSAAGLMSAADKKKLDGVPASAFLAAHPVGSLYMETRGANPGAAHGGTWVMRDSVNGFIWERTA